VAGFGICGVQLPFSIGSIHGSVRRRLQLHPTPHQNVTRAQARAHLDPSSHFVPTSSFASDKRSKPEEQGHSLPADTSASSYDRPTLVTDTHRTWLADRELLLRSQESKQLMTNNLSKQASTQHLALGSEAINRRGTFKIPLVPRKSSYLLTNLTTMLR